MIRLLQVAAFVVSLVSSLTARVDAADFTAEQRLANQLSRNALRLIEASQERMPVLMETSQAASLLHDIVVELQPDEVEFWRRALAIAELTNDEERISRALVNVARLEPRDDAVRLRIITEAMERYQTAPERIAAYERILAEDPASIVGLAVASHLALDLALLHQRVGDQDLFSSWLSKASAWDQSNKIAAAMAAGYFRMNVHEPYGEAELIINLLMADPISLTPYEALAELLLEHGAYEAAARLYTIVIERSGLTNKMSRLSDLALAHFGAGDAEAALDLLHRVQQRLDLIAQFRHKNENPGVDPVELVTKIKGEMPPELALIRAFIQTWDAGLHDPSASDSEKLKSFEDLHSKAWQTVSRVAGAAFQEWQKEQDPEKKQELHWKFQNLFLQRAWVGLWYFAEFDVAKYAADVQQSFQQVYEHVKFSQEAERRFMGWTLVRSGQLAEAERLLEPLIEFDPAARAGMALIRLEQERNSEAIRHLVTIYQEQPGTLLGIWAREKAEQLIGRPITGTELSRRLGELAANIPRLFDRFTQDPTLAFDIKLEPAKQRFEPFEPVIVNIHVRNNALMPLTIGPSGPIKDQVVVIPNVTRVNDPFGRELLPIVVPIDRRLRLRPGDEFVIPLDLRRTYLVEEFLDNKPFLGCTFRLRAITNFTTNANGRLQPGALGSQYRLRYPIEIRGIPGISKNDELNRWMLDTSVVLQAPAGPDDLSRLALYAHLVFDRQAEGGEPPEPAIKESLVHAFRQLEPAAQAWLLGAVPPPTRARFSELDAAARQVDHPLVIASYLSTRLTDLGDPMIDAAVRSAHPAVRRLGELWIAKRAVMERSQPTGSAAP